MQESDNPLATEAILSRLRQTVEYVKEKSNFYGRLYRDFQPGEIHSLEDFRRLPFVSKPDLATETKDFWCIESTDIIDLCSTSGTSGKPLTLPLSEKDLDRLAENEAGSFATAGITKYDIIQLCTTVDRQFMAGLAYLLGARRLGTTIIRTGPGLAEYQWNTILQAKTTVLIVVPSFLLKLLQYADENGIEPSKTTVRKAICIGEPIRNPDFSLNALGAKIKERWNIDLHSTYASSEMQTAFTECGLMRGGHYNPELIFPELIDQHGMPVSPGETGELAVTTLGVEGMPLVRYKTGDITTMHPGKCKCGNPSPRIGSIQGRKNQMIKTKGTTCYPPALVEALNEIPEIREFQIRVFRDEWDTDSVRVYYYSETQISSSDLRNHFRARLRFSPDFRAVSKPEIHEMVYPKDSRKPRLFLDLRGE